MKAYLRRLDNPLILSFLLLFTISVSAQELEIRELDADNYPEVKLIISGPSDLRMMMEEQSLIILENKVEAQAHYIRHGHPLAFGLRIFSSPKFIGNTLGDSTVEDLLINYLNSNFADIDYFFRKDIPQHGLYDALQVNLERFGRRKYRKRWFTLLVLDEGDTGSSTPFETIMGTIDFMHSPIYILFQGKEADKELSQLAEKSGGGLFLFDGSEEMLDKLKELNRLWRWGTEIRYNSPQKSKTDLRTVSMSLKDKPELGQILVESYEQKSDLKGGIDWDNWPTMVLAVLLSIGAVVLFFVWRSRRADANHIYPAITYVAPQPKKGKLKVRFNSPNKEMGSRITIATAGGKPVKDFQFSGTRRRARIQVGELSEGFYTCMLSNAGLNSEKVEFEIKGT
ncbi:MAG: hypothetical protein R8P61_04400 [Bacteroidia bacterium]|nr:hypothetical protein [Bacteroidia bacterium]